MKSTVRDDLRSEGYSLEEEYFYRRNRELIEKRRKELDAKKSGSKQPLTCPRCSSPMNELVKAGIALDQCSNCEGIYFDKGELETLVEAAGVEKFLEVVLKEYGRHKP